MQNILATGSSTHRADPRVFAAGIALAAAAVIAAVAIAVAPSLALRGPATVPADHSYTQVEAMRADAFAPGAADGSVRQAEQIRGGAFGSGGIIAGDSSYDAVEGLRAQR
jgi:hypothetical protein